MINREPGSHAVATASAGGISTGGALAIVFVVLKLCGVITWSWWWILAPVWIPMSIVLVILVGFVVLWLSVARAEERDRADRAETRRRREAGVPQPGEHGPAYRWGRWL